MTVNLDSLWGLNQEYDESKGLASRGFEAKVMGLKLRKLMVG